jgi:rod shape-determining protein MreD
MIKGKKNYSNLLALLLVVCSIFFNSIMSEFSITSNVNKFFNIQYLLIYFFCFNRFKYFSISILFVLGLINDSLLGTPFGMSAAAYMLIYKIAVYQHNIKLRSIFTSEWLAFGFSILAAYFLDLTILYTVTKSFDFELYIYNFIGTFFIYPILWVMLKYFFMNVEKIKNE